MPRYIDADLLMKELGITDPDCEKCEWGCKGFPSCSRDGDFVDACDAICEAPTADVVEVVRCKDCKHCEWYIKASYKNGVEVESHECRKYKMAVTRDWFCADGERREDE